MKTNSPSQDGATFTVATLNLLNDLTYWDRRGPLIVDELRRLKPDLIALQEVVFPQNTAQWINDRLEGYALFIGPKTGRRGAREGLAVLSRLPVIDQEVRPLGHQGRVALRVAARVEGHVLHFANAHLYWNPFSDEARRRQTRLLADWLPQPGIVCGDFNAEPHYRSIREFNRRFHSAHQRVHGREPDFTFPTRLFRGPAPKDVARRAALRLAGWAGRGRNITWHGVLDYIFVDEHVRVQDCQLAFHAPAGGDARLYPSDHRGLFARLRVADGASAGGG